MPYVPFYSHFPRIAERETRTIINFNDSDFPKGEYGFTESFCDECDCRRVVINVLNIEFENPLVATISHGWGTRSFYIRWLGYDEKETIDEMMGTHFMMMARQSQFAEPLLALFKQIVSTDIEYQKRIRRHYSMFRNKVKRISS